MLELRHRHCHPLLNPRGSEAAHDYRALVHSFRSLVGFANRDRRKTQNRGFPVTSPLSDKVQNAFFCRARNRRIPAAA